jgi:tetratricopeptide (TPR) repeat protein
MLPWIKLAAEMDPHEINTYLTAAYWLRTSLNQPREAEQFLREGLRANPDSYAISLDLGRVYADNWKNTRVARNIFEQAGKQWRKQDAAGNNPDPHAYEEILGEIVRTDQALGDTKQELADLEELVKVARGQETVQRQIDEIKAKLGESKK